MKLSTTSKDKFSKSFTSTARKFKATFDNAILNHFSCPICQCLVQAAILLNCSHVYCKACFCHWLSVQKSKGEVASCPLCRSKVPSSTISALEQPNVDLRSLNPPNFTPTHSPVHLFLERVRQVGGYFFHFQNEMNRPDDLSALLRASMIPDNFPSYLTVLKLTAAVDRMSHSEKSSVETLLPEYLNLVKILERENTLYYQRNQQTQKTLRQAQSSILSKVFTNISPSFVSSSLAVTLHCIWIHFVFHIWPFRCIPALGSNFRSHLWRNGQFSPTRCTISRPKPVAIFWMVFTSLFLVAVLTRGYEIIKFLDVFPELKRLLQHIVFMYVDTPTYEMISLVYEAFTTPL